MKLVSYVRVSTDRQGRSGLGMQAQEAAIARYAAGLPGAGIVGRFVEVESGRNDARPELHRAMRLAKVTGARLVIAKLDRLSRNAAFLLGLQAAGVDFVACDNPHANALTVGILALVAQNEAESISSRTKAALQAAKARGQRLGNPNGASALRRAGKGNAAASASLRASADAFAAQLVEILADVEAAGHQTLQSIASELNFRGIKTARGGIWHPKTIANLRARLAA